MTALVSLPFRNPDPPLDEHVHDLVSRLTLEETVGQMLPDAKTLPRLDIPARLVKGRLAISAPPVSFGLFRLSQF